MRILGIESSCDDTSAALVEAISTTPNPSPPAIACGSGRWRAGFPRREDFVVLAEKTASQVEVHKKYGGVVPEIAGRLHAEQILPIIDAVLEGREKPDAIAVTTGPGLITGLIVGVEAARTLSYLWDIPVIGVNHIEGHIHSVLLNELGIMNHELKIEFPALCLVVSGGHTELILMTGHGEYKKIGKTRDDAAGECFDKVGKLLGFEYPGGPKISTFAAEGNPTAIHFPRPMIDSHDYDFSFAGLKTATLYWLRDNHFVISTEALQGRVEKSGGHQRPPDSSTTLARSSSLISLGMTNKVELADICASFEQAIVDTLVAKTLRAAKEYKPKTIILAGGVAANKKLRETLHATVQSIIHDSLFMIPEHQYCTDNGAMIAVAGYYHLAKGETTPWRALQADPQWELP